MSSRKVTVREKVSPNILLHPVIIEESLLLHTTIRYQHAHPSEQFQEGRPVEN
jgi:hypothetical protein